MILCEHAVKLGCSQQPKQGEASTMFLSEQPPDCQLLQVPPSISEPAETLGPKPATMIEIVSALELV